VVVSSTPVVANHSGTKSPTIGEPDEVAKAVIYLVVDATYTTGSELVLDGGALLGPVLTIQ